MTNRVEDAFQRYMGMVYPGLVLSGRQLLECRNAFFAGVHWMQVKFPRELDMGDETTARDFEIMAEVNDEVLRHVASFIPTEGTA